MVVEPVSSRCRQGSNPAVNSYQLCGIGQMTLCLHFFLCKRIIIVPFCWARPEAGKVLKCWHSAGHVRRTIMTMSDDYDDDDDIDTQSRAAFKLAGPHSPQLGRGRADLAHWVSK